MTLEALLTFFGILVPSWLSDRSFTSWAWTDFGLPAAVCSASFAAAACVFVPFAASVAGALQKIYRDEGIFGTKASRPALDELLRDCRRKAIIDVVVVWKFEPFARKNRTTSGCRNRRAQREVSKSTLVG